MCRRWPVLTKLFTWSSSLMLVDGPTTTFPQHLESLIRRTSSFISFEASTHLPSSRLAITISPTGCDEYGDRTSWTARPSDVSQRPATRRPDCCTVTPPQTTLFAQSLEQVAGDCAMLDQFRPHDACDNSYRKTRFLAPNWPV